MPNIELTDAVVIPVMEKHKVSREEAEKRLQLLFQSGILDTGGPENQHTQMLIDNFLSMDSADAQGAVNYEKMFTKCLSNAELVRQYDRLHFTNLTKALRKANAGLPPANFKRQLEGFEKFCEETIFSRLPKQ